ncbi:MAG TPA: hypothetical protein VGK29_19530 [Paludibaculum sp.]
MKTTAPSSTGNFAPYGESSAWAVAVESDSRGRAWGGGPGFGGEIGSAGSAGGRGAARRGGEIGSAGTGGGAAGRLWHGDRRRSYDEQDGSAVDW